MRKPNAQGLRINSNRNTPDLINLVDVVMSRYGIGIEEFKRIPIPTFFALCNIIAEEGKKLKKR